MARWYTKGTGWWQSEIVEGVGSRDGHGTEIAEPTGTTQSSGNPTRISGSEASGTGTTTTSSRSRSGVWDGIRISDWGDTTDGSCAKR